MYMHWKQQLHGLVCSMHARRYVQLFLTCKWKKLTGAAIHCTCIRVEPSRTFWKLGPDTCGLQVRPGYIRTLPVHGVVFGPRARKEATCQDDHEGSHHR